MEKYRLIGIMNIMKKIPDFVYTVFEKDGDYYFENSDDFLEITSFEKVVGLEHLRKIEKLEEKTLLTTPEKEYKIGSEPIIGYQLDTDRVFIGTFDDFSLFANDNNLEDPTIKDEIEQTEKKRRESKALKLRKKRYPNG